MRAIERSTSFRRDLKRELAGHHGKHLETLLGPVVDLLLQDKPLPVANRDHPLTGEWATHRDCHLRPDLVLIYQKLPGRLRLVRLGSHSELFG
jgi:mRNA interferase YafQ